ncbi:MAG: RDD family protein [Candidatus Thalassarchaeaceae archaeon]|jgi:hypothetical protein|nr:RDD family protein [Candidatus Thalassarchaeaceae archaeon]MDP6703317.1 RDD family protein [Candidatus Thalassarchaeaceae archaeon]MDP7004088.1 RDD family protein [Candidatus Thalassarchaeaceae archaeon]
MADHDSPLSLHGGTTVAKAIVSQSDGYWSVPEGTILASTMGRIVSFVIDVIIVTTILMIATRSMIRNAWSLTLWISPEFHFALAFALILLASHWLYWRVTGVTFSRSLGQRMFGLAVVCDDGSCLTGEMWDRRSLRKLVYLLPIVNLYFGVYEIARISQRHTHQSNLDLEIGTIVAHADSLPPASRRHIR